MTHPVTNYSISMSKTGYRAPFLKNSSKEVGYICDTELLKHKVASLSKGFSLIDRIKDVSQSILDTKVKLTQFVKNIYQNLVPYVLASTALYWLLGGGTLFAFFGAAYINHVYKSWKRGNDQLITLEELENDKKYLVIGNNVYEVAKHGMVESSQSEDDDYQLTICPVHHTPIKYRHRYDSLTSKIQNYDTETTKVCLEECAINAICSSLTHPV